MKFTILISAVSAWPLFKTSSIMKRQANATTTTNSTVSMMSNGTMTNSTTNSTSMTMTPATMELQFCPATQQRYVPMIYTCFSTALCKTGLMACGPACYDPSLYGCLDGELFQVGMLPVAAIAAANSTIAVVAGNSTAAAAANSTAM